MTIEYLLYQVLRLGSVLIVGYLAGLLVIHRGVKVNYTRKLFHFAIFFFPVLFAPDFDVDGNPVSLSASTGVILMLGLGLFLKPIRNRWSFASVLFRAIDRPEDRPYTLFWLSTQVITGYIVIVFFVIAFGHHGMGELMMIPILINGIGDGLAEPVGVRYGRHSYPVPAFLSSRRYQRTLEGSACVFITSLLVVPFFHDHFTGQQLITALIAMPVIMTLAEAFSPHTWDTPFIFLAGGFSLLAITQFI